MIGLAWAVSTPGLDALVEAMGLNQVDPGTWGLVAGDSSSLSLYFLRRLAHLQESNHCEMSDGPGLSRLWKLLNIGNLLNRAEAAQERLAVGDETKKNHCLAQCVSRSEVSIDFRLIYTSIGPKAVFLLMKAVQVVGGDIRRSIRYEIGIT